MSTPAAWPDGAWRTVKADFACSACGTRLGSIEPVVGSASEPGWDYGAVHEVEKVVGLRVELTPGFVNAKRSHPEGHPWYIRGPDPERLSAKVRRIPVVVTCKCGRDALVTYESDEPNAFATTSRTGWWDRIADEAGDSHIQEQIDIARGK